MREFIAKQDVTFDPEAIEIMVRAFDDCWDTVQRSGADLNQESARNTLARYIVTAALEGERDPQRLSQLAVLHLAQETALPAPPRKPNA
jgi:hypothetical protein